MVTIRDLIDDGCGIDYEIEIWDKENICCDYEVDTSYRQRIIFNLPLPPTDE